MAVIAQKIFTATAYLTVVFVIGSLVLQIPISYLMISGYTVEPEMKHMMNLYAVGLIISNSVTVINMVCSYILIASGQAKSLLKLSILESVLNLALDLLFVPVCGLGVLGAGLGTIELMGCDFEREAGAPHSLKFGQWNLTKEQQHDLLEWRRTVDMGVVRDAYAPGEAYYPASVDFVRDDRPFRIWADRLMPRVEIPADAPAKVAQVWGPDRASKLADVDWTAVSVPGAALPDAQGWKRPSCPPDGLSTLVAAPIKTRGDGPEETALRELLKGADHARYVVYDFSASRDGRAVLRLNASPKYRAPTIYLNGVKSAFKGDRQAIAVRKGPNRLLLRADAVCGGYYTDTLYLNVE